MNFTAIDFETATSKYTSICSIGICVVKDGEIVERKGMLIRPKSLEFNDYNIKIHGITPDMVMDAPTFEELWDTIRPYIDGKIVVAHNSMFDVSALCATLEDYGIEFPSFRYLCTVKLSQKAYPEFPSHKLNNLCDELGIEFSHHQAYDDAYACAEVLLSIMKDCNVHSLKEIEEHFEVDCGRIYPGCKISFKQKKKAKKTNRKYTRKVKKNGQTT